MSRHSRVVLFLLLALALALLAGCGQAPAEQPAKERPVWNAASQVVMTFQTIESSRVDDLDEVLDAINAITVPELDIEVVLRQVDAVDAFSAYYVWLSNSEPVDLMMLNYQDITAYIGRDLLLPLDDLLEQEGAGIQALLGQGYSLTDGTIVGGKTYGLSPLATCQGSGGGIWLPRRYLTETGTRYDPQHVYTFDELTALFQKLKARYPAAYPLGQITSGNTFSTASYYMQLADALGDNVLTGVLAEDGATIVDFFATPEYEAFLRTMQRWYESGFIYPDAAITDADLQELIREEIVLSWPLASQPGIVDGSDFGEEIVCLRTTPVILGGGSSTGVFWTIPQTSKDPEAAMRLLNALYTDARLVNLFAHGIEGEHYVLTDPANGVIAYPEGKGPFTLGYFNPLGLYGNRLLEYSTDTPEQQQKRAAYSAEALQNPAGIRGFTFVGTAVLSERDKVEKVAEKYLPLLESGSLNVDTYYPVFLQELERAGMGTLVAEKQRQFDLWRAQQGG